MGILTTLLGPVLSFIGKPLAQYQETKKVIVEAKVARQAAEQADATLWETNVLVKSGMALRWICALHLFGGMDYTIYACMTGKDATILWEALDLMPDWYAGLLATMFAFAFGSKGIKKAGAALVSQWRKKEKTDGKEDEERP